ncbi:MAG TPA: sporulation protein, partial [Acidimicrobiales bacterium]|nr:sporulation protein [Acidimicrobiales bacterium]
VHEHVVVTEAPIVPPGAAVAPGDHVVSLHVPEDGLPSATDQVQWSVRARIDRHLGADVEAEAPVEVLAGPERFAAEATGDARYKGERCIDLELSTRTLRPGETITGKVVLAPAQAVTVTVTNVLVLFVVTTPAKQGLEGAGVAARTLLDEPLELQPGETRSLGFELTLPQDAAPTVRGSLTTPPCHSVVSWDVGAEATAVVSGGGATERKGFVYLGVNVYNAVAAPAPPGGA